jgi:hypothetical protein
VDNATDGDGKEFFTVETAEGNVFYLIVDRQRAGDNVYLLNAVSEDDLASLAKPGSGKSVSAVETPPVTSAEPTPDAPEPKPTAETPEQKSGNNNTATIAFIVIAALIFGGAAYYFKIVRPKKTAAGYEPDYRETDEDAEYDLEDDGGEGKSE